ncbi:unnamed protein product [Pleuronectes platessa]|uniref:Uncharacterized protein n=1 Tax=Pleuronectes platessa TaxID=8262 RepID=A0A9N7TU56_PLEPL|nr:unnamed protein product [Pleuronectes platessa]
MVLIGFGAGCEMFPLLGTNVTVNASVCRGLSGHHSLEKTSPSSHLSIHSPHLRAEQEERKSWRCKRMEVDAKGITFSFLHQKETNLILSAHFTTSCSVPESNIHYYWKEF